ncbi:unnamed protein product [Adineta ricciae]|uniref:Uncharacterized protein n=1 Tax=Adineta ricciae TaxID=249248 RepID=A0A813ZNR9_ADIRI|nr:unnamed protein product [Adineta ricciae]
MFQPKQLKQFAAQCLAELFGTFLLILIGNLSVAQFKFTKPTPNNNIGVNLSYATGVYVALMVAGPISGAHVNPAVSLGLLALRKLKLLQCVMYIFGQIVGAFLASAMVYLVYISQFNLYDGGIRQHEGPNATADIFYTVPAEGVPNWNCLLDAIIGASLLMIFIMALGNDYNHLISNAAKPFSFVLMVTTFGFAMGLNCGNPINPVRDFGPRLFASIIYGPVVFRANQYYFWITIVGPIIGALIGVYIFEGYLILMKKYANLPGITHIDAIEQPDQGKHHKKTHPVHTQLRSLLNSITKRGDIMAKVRELQQYLTQGLAECFGTFMLILIGESAIAQYKLSRQGSHSTITINLAFGIGVYTAIMIAGPVSGAHLNPALSISLLTVRKLKPIQCLIYIIGQMIGAFLGAYVVYYLYLSLLNDFDGAIRQVSGIQGTADIFFTMPTHGVTGLNSFFDQVIGTAVLMIFVMALINDTNRMISDVAKPFAFVLIIVGITSAFAANAGAAINPARDLGPRLFAAFVYGWGEVFRAHNYFFWIPIIGPIVGGIIGVWLYEGFFSIVKRYGNLPVTKNESNESYSKVKCIDDDDNGVLTHELTTIRT